MMWLLAATLVMAPHLDEPGPVRLASDGTGDAPVRWLVEGREVATTRDGEAAVVDFGKGTRHVVATTDFDGPWRALVRPAPVTDNVTAVPAWTANHDPVRPSQAVDTDAWLPWALVVLALGVVLWPSKQP